VEAGTSQTQAIEREVRIDASPDTVFEFFTDPEKMVRWMGTSATLDPRPGGVFRVEMNPQAIGAGEYVDVDPPNRVVFTFGWEGGENPAQPGSSTVQITLTRDGDGTKVRLVHTGLPSPESAARHTDGWDTYLDRLVIAGAGGDAGPDPHQGDAS
jgi:uncharacterized protein YndB with AHSA1/START domain